MRPQRPTAVVTGAGRGIGLAIATALAPTHRLIVVGRNEQRLAAAATEIGGDVATYSADLGDRSARAGLAAALADFDPAVSVLINNAGVAGSAALSATDDATWHNVLEVNLTAAFALSRALAPGMVAAGWGRIVNVASTAALKGYRFTTAYSASKAGLVGLTRALAAELTSGGVTVNAVCPGFTDTDIVAEAVKTITDKTGRTAAQARASLERFSPLGRLVSPQEVAAMVAYLCSEHADAITGQALVLDGGETVL